MDSKTDHLVRKLRLRHLELLVALSETATMRGASARLHLSQPAISKMLGEIESCFGARLFERSHQAGMTRLRMCVALAFLTDPTWGFAEQRARAGRLITWSYWMGLALVFTAAWTGATMAGAWLGAYLGDPRQIGADFALAALFIGMTARFWTGWRRTGFAIAASGLSSAVVFHTLGAPWHVMAGAAAGIAVAYFAAPPQAAQEPQST